MTSYKHYIGMLGCLLLVQPYIGYSGESANRLSAGTYALFGGLVLAGGATWLYCSTSDLASNLRSGLWGLLGGTSKQSTKHANQIELHDAVKQGDYTAVHLLIRSDLDVNFVDKYGRTALQYAIIHADAAIAYLLITEPKVNLDVQDNRGRTALHYAAMKGDAFIVTMLLERGAQHLICSAHGLTAWHYAARACKTDVLLLLHDYDPRQIIARDDFGRTALHCAVVKPRDREAIRVLCRVGVAVDARCNKGATALHYAAQGGYADVILELAETYKALLDLQSVGGRTALHNAASHGHVRAVQALQRLGVNIDAKTCSGKTALELAQGKGHAAVVNVLTPLTA